MMEFEAGVHKVEHYRVRHRRAGMHGTGKGRRKLKPTKRNTHTSHLLEYEIWPVKNVGIHRQKRCSISKMFEQSCALIN